MYRCCSCIRSPCERVSHEEQQDDSPIALDQSYARHRDSPMECEDLSPPSMKRLPAQQLRTHQLAVAYHSQSSVYISHVEQLQQRVEQVEQQVAQFQQQQPASHMASALCAALQWGPAEMIWKRQMIAGFDEFGFDATVVIDWHVVSHVLEEGY